jgi:murein DD-endopeptidase MepM/ murein hydrolase activator NlpD
MLIDFKPRAEIWTLLKQKRPGTRPLIVALAGTVTLIFASILLFSSTPTETQEIASQDDADMVMELALPPEHPEGDGIQQAATTNSENKLQTIIQALTLPANLFSQQQEISDTPQEQKGRWLQEEVQNGDSLALIFSRLELSPTLLHNITHSSEEAAALAQIKPGELLQVQLDMEGKLMQLLYQRSLINSLKITPTEDGFQTEVLTKHLEKRTSHLSATITDSLYSSALRAGLSDSLIMELANIFGWDIDFALEIRKGDQFSLIFEEEYLAGEHYRDGAIIAAEFTNRGKVFRAIRYENDKGEADYFTPDGKSMRKAFLRAPVDFRRISSRFARERWHPVLGKKRPHRGVDYAAATGTPIKAAGDGRVVFRGRKGGYGRTVIIKHGERYSTLYAHMSKYRGSVKNGTRVRQGQTIGYVGMSGLATGPHLHYEFRVNGVHRNPLTVKLPAAEPIADQYLADFKLQSKPLLAQLDIFSKVLLAHVEIENEQEER